MKQRLPTYDLAFAGPRNRYTIRTDAGPLIVHNCGYGMGAEKFRTTAAAAPYFIELTAAQATAHLWAWRDGNQAILRYWRAVEEAVRRSVRRHGAVIELSHGMAVRTLGGTTQVKKPNGVPLTYHNMRLEDRGLVFDGVNSISKKWQTERTYGGRLVENIVQSVARDVMAEGMLRNPSRAPVMSVHDEIVWEVPETEDPEYYRLAVENPPDWAAGLPVAAKLSTGRRYAK